MTSVLIRHDHATTSDHFVITLSDGVDPVRHFRHDHTMNSVSIRHDHAMNSDTDDQTTNCILGFIPFPELVKTSPEPAIANDEAKTINYLVFPIFANRIPSQKT